MRSRPLPALLALLALALLAAGCGGSGSSADESKARRQLEAGGQKLTDADSFEVSLLFEVEEDGSEPEELGCLDLGVDNHRPVSIDMRIYDLNCSGGSEGTELIAIGRRAWASTGAGRYTAARITPQVAKELDDEQTDDLAQLFEAAEGIKAYPKGAAVIEGDGRSADATAFTFHAPASAFPDSEDLGDTDVEFEAAVDRHGFLRQLVLHGEAEGAGATVTESYEDIDADLGISPPARSEVHGSTKTIRSRADLDELVGNVAAP
jgi:hypothetical protein